MAKQIFLLAFSAQIALGLAWVVLLTSEVQFKGKKVTMRGLEEECLNFRDFVPKSISTNNYCLKVFDEVECRGNWLSFFPGSYYHHNLTHFNLEMKSMKSCQTSF